MAKPQSNVINKFKHALLKNDKKLMHSYVTEGLKYLLPKKKNIFIKF